MIILITGASHTGKTVLAQKLLEKYNYPYLSIDHLKMGLIRSKNTELTPLSPDSELTDYLWPIVCEMVKTAIENNQNMIVEGCYIPFDWQKDFEEHYLKNIKYYCLVMSEDYIKNNFTDIKKYASIIENRLDDDCTLDGVLRDNAKCLKLAQKHKVNYILIEDKYDTDIGLRKVQANINYLIREIKQQEYDILEDFLYEAIFIPDGVEPPPKDIIKNEELQVYVKDFGKEPHDKCFVAETDGKVVGAVWVRIMNDYGHVDDKTPSFAISLYKEYRGYGIGTDLMKKMLAFLKDSGYKQASLAVQKANYAVKMYLNVGFEIVDENAEEYIMLCRLN